MSVTYNHMVVKQTDEWANRAFHALADSTRRDMVMRCIHSSPSISALASFYPMSFAAVQKHVAVLEHAGLVSKHRRGREQLIVAERTGVGRASALLQQFEATWRGRLERFEEIVDSENERGQ
jgi:DNA-binding transcriptional ArsR family regulator